MSLNPVADFAENSDWIMEFLQKLACQTLTPEQLHIARNSALMHAKTARVSIGSLVALWSVVPELQQFASALGGSAVPGRFDALFSPGGPNPPDYPSTWNPAAFEPVKWEPVAQGDRTAFEWLASRTRRLPDES